MTTKEKNESIARMIGWKIKKHSLGYYYWEKPDGTKLPAFKPLTFHSDANWQYEAEDWVNSNLPWARFNIRTSTMEARYESMFESLFQIAEKNKIQ